MVVEGVAGNHLYLARPRSRKIAGVARTSTRTRCPCCTSRGSAYPADVSGCAGDQNDLGRPFAFGVHA